MKTKTYTLLVTITDDGIAAAFNPDILAAAIQGALQNGIPSFVLDSTQVRKLGIPGIKVGEHHLSPVANAHVTAFPGDLIGASPEPLTRQVVVPIANAKAAHALQREGRG